VSAERRGPSLVWYGVAGVLAVAAVVAGVVVIVVGIVRYDQRIDDFQRVDVPGTGVLTFLDDGGYTAYFESPYDCEAECAPDLAIDVEPIDSAPAVRVGDYDGSFTYDDGDRHGEAVATLRIPEPGRYRIRVTDVSESGQTGRLAVGRSVGKVILYGFLAGFAIIMLGVLLAGALALLVGLRRVAAKYTEEPAAY
jgi:hypothetical protein